MGFLLNPFRLIPPAAGNIQYVGSTYDKNFITNRSISLTALTGGIGSAAIEGDFVIALSLAASNQNRTLGISTAGFETPVANLYSNSTNDAMLYMATKIMTSTPDTTVAFTGTTSSGASMSAGVHVFRGVHLTTPLDTFVEGGLVRTNTQNNTAEPNPAAATPQTAGAKLFIAMVSAHVLGAVNLAQSYLSNAIVDNRDGSTTDMSLAIGTVDWTGGTYDAAIATLTGSSGTDSTASAVIAMRPAA